MRAFLKYLVEKHVTRKKLFIFAIFTFCFLIFADYSTRSNKELDSMGKNDKVPNSEVESSYSIDKEGTETELEEDQDNQGSTVEEEIFAEEYEGSSFEISGTEE